MGAAYTIFGRQVPSHILSIATLGTAAAVVAWPRAKKEAPPAQAAPVAQTKEEDFDLEKFLKYVYTD
ncbi:DEHA2G05588p [Debaryomyces hansenii CBS767]|uniref:DEHA2G05588p n=1 Tax=Debaryomyces hansenii (strain ATCC 36239 / CBS 767 / BCRC 21394 / JCM 1990 / NBRC 0083 / IGC 2968) TaxID=284592 RepID=Q6BJ32_DEBHA|nr:DEHA2G05588p [Debaryomyces hansenii CBS767]CAG90248.1 DEHA2G05588p [Debaryomyces hansenii CBS767]|eukprot:XP_461789.1 DEHA2G05588p [Debaryomyces hansenii CBS767]